MTTTFDFGGLSDVFFSGAAGEAKDDAFEAFSVASPEQVIPASPAASLSTPLHTPTHSTPAHHGLGELDDLLGGENEHGNQLDAATIHDLMSDAAPWGLSGQPNSFDSVAAFPSVGNVFAGLNMDGSMDPVDLRGGGGGGGFDGFAEPAPVSCLITSSSSSNASDAGSSGGDEAEEEETASKRPFSPPQTRAAAKAKAAAVAAASTNTDSDPAPMTKQKKKGKRGRKPKSQSAAATEQTSGGYSTKNGGKKGTKKRASGRRPGRPSRYTEVDVEVNIPDEPVAEGAYDGMSEGQIAEEERKRKNRLAAKASRLKRKIFLENLETNYETLSTEHEAALDTIDALEAERNTLAREVAYLRGIIDNSETLAGIFGDVAPRLRALRDRNAGRKRSASAAYDDDDDEDDAENDFGATGLCVCLRANGAVSVEMCSSCADPRPPSKRTKVEA